MWKRKDVKKRGRGALKGNYWKSIIVALIVATAIGGMSSASAGVGSAAGAAGTSAGTLAGTSAEQQSIFGGAVQGELADAQSLITPAPMDKKAFTEFINNKFGLNLNDRQLGFYIAGIASIVGVLAIIGILLSIFLYMPMEVGCRRFFIKNLNEKAQLKEVAFGYDNNYKNVVKTLFLRSLIVFLLSLLLVIPGIIMSYAYRMVPYILAENPDMKTRHIFKHSRELMKGNKWKAFVLDLSFIGWVLLSVLTMGLLYIFYVGPFYHSTCAALYETLEYKKNMTEEVVASDVAVEPVADYMTEPSVEPMVEPSVEPAVETVVEPAVETVIEPSVDSATDSLTGNE